MPVIIASVAFMIIVYLVGKVKIATYLGIPHVAGAGELAIFCGAMVGGGHAFLWFTAPPAAVFMGDTGSLALGGPLGEIEEIGRASCRERVCPDVDISVDAVVFKKQSL